MLIDTYIRYHVMMIRMNSEKGFYPRVVVVMNKDNFEEFAAKCKKKGLKLSQVGNMLFKRWVNGEISEVRKSRAAQPGS